jgi:hypothetical protein
MRSSSKWISLAVAAFFLSGLLVSPVSGGEKAGKASVDPGEIQASDTDLKPGPKLPSEKPADPGEVRESDTDLKAGPKLPGGKDADPGEIQAKDVQTK